MCTGTPSTVPRSVSPPTRGQSISTLTFLQTFCPSSSCSTGDGVAHDNPQREPPNLLSFSIVFNQAVSRGPGSGSVLQTPCLSSSVFNSISFAALRVNVSTSKPFVFLHRVQQQTQVLRCASKPFVFHHRVQLDPPSSRRTSPGTSKPFVFLIQVPFDTGILVLFIGLFRTPLPSIPTTRTTTPFSRVVRFSYLH